MRILLLHNRYIQPGGEDAVVEQEAALLTRYGHVVERLEASNEGLDYAGRRALTSAAISSVWSIRAHAQVRAMISKFKPDILHCHNTFPMFSPSVYHAAKGAGVPVVQTLHNFRLLCLNALLFRDGHACMDCVGKLPLDGIRHACYRGSRVGSAAVAAMVTLHHIAGTWRSAVSRYIVPSEHARIQFINGGLDGKRLRLKPNFVHPDPGPGDHESECALFVGRLSEEKGIRTLLAAWELIGEEIPLRIIGDGPLREEAERASQSDPTVAYLGRLSPTAVLNEMKRASFLVMPSVSFELGPLALIEAFATGLPIVASDHGALASGVDPNRTGWLFPPGDEVALAERARAAWRGRDERAAKSAASRAEYLARYTAATNYEALIDIYREAIAERPDFGRDGHSAGVMAKYV